VLLSPRYDAQPLVRIEADDDVCAAVVGQRARLGALLAELDARQWATPSRCEGWTVQDVIAHLIGTNQFWALSLTAGMAGEPTRYLATFDPVATPAEMVAGLRDLDPAEVLVRYTASADALAEVVGQLAGLGPGVGAVVAEAPPGHVAAPAVLSHALWDALVHERDVALPLGIEPGRDATELAISLRYAAALGPALKVAQGSARSGRLAVDASDPACRFVVEVGEAEVVVRDGEDGTGLPTLRGPALVLLEGLSFRAPLEHQLAEDDRWLLAGLDEVFDLVD
jgi:uncharacterized protein (TIGR03083 family)